jgi:hypothetical protein
MVGVALVLFTLQEYGSPQLAGLVTFAALFPGLVVSPICGALLDRHGRTRLILLDYVVELVALSLIGVLALTDHLPAPLLVLIATITSFTAILSHTGLRSLFPILVPRHLWERVNAVDSNGYVIATIVGPPLAAALVAVFGGAVALIGVALAFGLAAVTMIGVPDRVGDRLDGPAARRCLAGRRLLVAQSDPARSRLRDHRPERGLRDEHDPHPGPRPPNARRERAPGRAGVRRVRRVGDDLGAPVRSRRQPRPGVADARRPDAPARTGLRPDPAGRQRRRGGAGRVRPPGVSSLVPASSARWTSPCSRSVSGARTRLDGSRVRRVDGVQLHGLPRSGRRSAVLVAISLTGAVGFGVAALIAGCVLAATMVPRQAPEAGPAG